MLTPQELKKSPLFQDIGYENYQQMLDCFQAVQRSYRVDEVIYDFSGPAGNAVGVVERGEASLIRIDEEVCSARAWRFPPPAGTAWKWSAARPATWCSSTILIF